MSSTRLKLEKNQANAKQHPETELLLFANYSRSLFTLLSKKIGSLGKISKIKIMSVFIKLIMMKMKMKMKNT